MEEEEGCIDSRGMAGCVAEDPQAGTFLEAVVDIVAEDTGDNLGISVAVVGAHHSRKVLAGGVAGTEWVEEDTLEVEGTFHSCIEADEVGDIPSYHMEVVGAGNLDRLVEVGKAACDCSRNNCCKCSQVEEHLVLKSL